MGEVVGRITPSPQRVLDRLAKAEGPVNSWDLLREIDARPTTSETVTLRVYIHRIRAMLGKDAIQNVRGQGYQLSEECRRLLAS